MRVLDLTRVLAGPLCTMMLGDLGADVLKVERPGGGDETRGWGPPFDDRGERGYFLSVNRNKKSLVADLDSPDDLALIARLAKDARVVVDNFRPGTLERRGLDPAAIVAADPRRVWCTITGFGPDSPRPGYDFVVQAERGWMAITGEPDGSPMKVGVALADVIAGKDAAIAILAALAGENLTERQRRIHISLADSATAALINVAQNVLLSGRDAERYGNAHPNLVPYQLLRTGDRPMVIAVGSDAQWQACTRSLDLPDLAEDPALATNAGRLAAAGVPGGLVPTVKEALAMTDASPRYGVVPSVPGTIRFLPPRLGEHDREIRTLGWGAFA